MSSAITAPTYDPTSTAQALAQKTIADAQTQLTNQSNTASATANALTSLSSAISTFQSSLSSLAGLGHSVLAQSAALSDNTVGTATAKSTAPAGTYNLFVKQVATAGKVSYDNLPDASPPGGTLTLNVGSAAPIKVDLDAANTDGGNLSVREIAAAINTSSSNNGLVSAGVITVPITKADGTPGSEMRLVLTSKNTGAANTISMSASGADPTLESALNAAPTSTTAGKDAIVLLDAQYDANGTLTGTTITQASNTFTNIDGVSFTATHAQAAGADPITLTVGSDSSGTATNVQAFVDAYNKLKSTLDGMLDPGDPSNNKAAGIFAHDSGMEAMRTRLSDLLRPTGSLSLASYGITASRDGSLALDTARLNKQLAANPDGLDQLMGTVSLSGSTGVLGSLNTYLNQWSNTTSGQIKQRTDANTQLQSSLTKRQSDLTDKYNTAYDRYLKQFTALQTLQSTMNSNLSMLNSLFGSDQSSS